MLSLRVASSLVLIPLLLGAAWFGEPWTTLIVGVFVVTATWEFYQLAGRAGFHPLRYLGVGLAVAFLLAPTVQPWLPFDAPGAILAIGVMLLVGARLLRREATIAFADWAVTLAGAGYLGWLLAHWVLLRGLPDGREWVIYGLLATFSSDTSAFFIGRAFGRRRLAPSISPGKSWEGAIGSAIATPLASIGLVAVLGLPVTVPAAIGVGLAVSVAAQVGDLAESALKRAAQVKDASEMIPGHGGVLDRTDSLTFVGAVVYYLVVAARSG